MLILGKKKTFYFCFVHICPSGGGKCDTHLQKSTLLVNQIKGHNIINAKSMPKITL